MGNTGKVLLINGIWRAGTTYIWSKVRENLDWRCYYEPLHEVLSVYHPSRNDDNLRDEVWKMMRHPAMTQGYFDENRPFPKSFMNLGKGSKRCGASAAIRCRAYRFRQSPPQCPLGRAAVGSGRLDRAGTWNRAMAPLDSMFGPLLKLDGGEFIRLAAVLDADGDILRAAGEGVLYGAGAGDADGRWLFDAESETPGGGRYSRYWRRGGTIELDEFAFGGRVAAQALPALWHLNLGFL